MCVWSFSYAHSSVAQLSELDNMVVSLWLVIDFSGGEATVNIKSGFSSQNWEAII